MLIKKVCNKDKNNYYYNIFLEKAAYELPKNNFYIKYKCYIMIELTYLRELVLRQANPKSVKFVTFDIF